jgi:endoglucanase
MWAAAWLHKASTNDSFYLQYIQANGKPPGANDGIYEFSWENKHAGISVLLSKVITTPQCLYQLSLNLQSYLYLLVCQCFQDYLSENISFLESYQEDAESFICSLLPETSDSHVQYTPGY